MDMCGDGVLSCEGQAVGEGKRHIDSELNGVRLRENTGLQSIWSQREPDKGRGLWEVLPKYRCGFIPRTQVLKIS